MTLLQKGHLETPTLVYEKNARVSKTLLTGVNDETICIGDDGGPAVYEYPFDNNRAYLFGIASEMPRILHANGTLLDMCGLPQPIIPAKFSFLDNAVDRWYLWDSTEVRYRQEVYDCLADINEFNLINLNP